MLHSFLPNIPYGSHVFLNSSIESYVYALGIFIVLFIVFRIFRSIVLAYARSLAKKTTTDIDDAAISVVESLHPSFYIFLAFYLAFQMLIFNVLIHKVLYGVFLVWIVVQVIIALQILTEYILKKKILRGGGKETVQTKAAIGSLSTIAKVIFWILGTLLILSNLGINITSLIAGLGIGGIAIAFALQNILTDLFSSFAIYFDKPFQVGDFIVVGDKTGVVEKIGIKTTRLRALQGEEIVFSNRELTSAQIHNFKKLKERRIVFSLGVIYETANEKLKKIPEIIKKVIQSEENTRFDRAHFKEFDAWSLNFEIVYYAQTDDYAAYMDTQQAINLALKESFEEEGIEMAFPTQTLYIKK